MRAGKFKWFSGWLVSALLLVAVAIQFEGARLVALGLATLAAMVWLFRAADSSVKRHVISQARVMTTSQLQVWLHRRPATRRRYVWKWATICTLVAVAVGMICVLIFGSGPLPGLSFLWLAWRGAGHAWDARVSECQVRGLLDKVEVIIHEPPPVQTAVAPEPSRLAPPPLAVSISLHPQPAAPARDNTLAVLLVAALVTIALLVSYIATRTTSTAAASALQPSPSPEPFDFSNPSAEVQESARRAMVKHPDAGKEGSKLQESIRRTAAKFRVERPDYFDRPDWPELIADLCAMPSLDERPKETPTPKVLPTPAQVAPAPPAQDPRFAPYMQAAYALYPELQNLKGPLRTAVNAEIEAMRLRNDPELGLPNSPLTITNRVAKRLGIAPVNQGASTPITPKPIPSRVEISMIRKSNRSNAHERIEAFGGVNPGGSVWMLSQAVAVAEVQSGRISFYTNRGGRTAEIRVHASPAGNLYLKTVGDKDQPNNLLSLPEIPRR